MSNTTAKSKSEFTPILKEMQRAYFQSEGFKGKQQSRKDWEKMALKGLTQFLENEAENIQIKINYDSQ